MARHNSDYIPYESELIAEAEARKEWQKTHPDPRHDYIAEYDVFIGGKRHHRREVVTDWTLKDAENAVKEQWGKVGLYVQNLIVTTAEIAASVAEQAEAKEDGKNEQTQEA